MTPEERDAALLRASTAKGRYEMARESKAFWIANPLPLKVPDKGQQERPGSPPDLGGTGPLPWPDGRES